MAFEKTVCASSENHVNSTAATVDGDAATCFTTAVEPNPWWTVDLAVDHLVSAVALQTTSDSAGEHGIIVPCR